MTAGISLFLWLGPCNVAKNLLSPCLGFYKVGGPGHCQPDLSDSKLTACYKRCEFPSPSLRAVPPQDSHGLYICHQSLPVTLWELELWELASVVSRATAVAVNNEHLLVSDPRVLWPPMAVKKQWQANLSDTLHCFYTGFTGTREQQTGSLFIYKAVFHFLSLSPFPSLSWTWISK